MMTDPIADMLTRIRNASLVHKKEVAVPFSKIKMTIANLLVREGYLVKAEHKDKEKPSYLLLTLKYEQGQPAIGYLKRISKPGNRFYVKSDEIKPVLNGFGLAVLSTPKGILTNKEAVREKVGGEVICEIY